MTVSPPAHGRLDNVFYLDCTAAVDKQETVFFVVNNIQHMQTETSITPTRCRRTTTFRPQIWP